MEKTEPPGQSQDEETDQTVSEFPLTDDGILITVGRTAILVMAATLAPETRRALNSWLRDVFTRGLPIRIDLPKLGTTDEGEIKLPPGSRKISAFVYGDTISLPN